MPLSYDAMYRALVTSTNDPTNSGKIRVQCPQISGVAEIRSAEPVNPSDRVPAVGSTVWLSFNGGDLTKPLYYTNTDFVEAHPNGSVSLTSLATSADLDPLRALALSGDNNQPSGTFNTPTLVVTDGNATSAADISVSGSVYSTNKIGTPEVWHTPTFGSGWTTTGTFAGAATFHGMQYRRDAEDNVLVYGCAVTSSGATGTIFTLPSDYMPAVRGFLPVQIAIAGSISGNIKTTMAQVTSAGLINISMAVSGYTIAANDQVFINGKFPLGNLS